MSESFSALRTCHQGPKPTLAQAVLPLPLRQYSMADFDTVPDDVRSFIYQLFVDLDVTGRGTVLFDQFRAVAEALGADTTEAQLVQ